MSPALLEHQQTAKVVAFATELRRHRTRGTDSRPDLGQHGGRP
jgi:hypothetical protein